VNGTLLLADWLQWAGGASGPEAPTVTTLPIHSSKRHTSNIKGTVMVKFDHLSTYKSFSVSQNIRFSYQPQQNNKRHLILCLDLYNTSHIQKTSHLRYFYIHATYIQIQILMFAYTFTPSYNLRNRLWCIY